jgi:hypothetical protein
VRVALTVCEPGEVAVAWTVNVADWPTGKAPTVNVSGPVVVRPAGSVTVTAVVSDEMPAVPVFVTLT